MVKNVKTKQNQNPKTKQDNAETLDESGGCELLMLPSLTMSFLPVKCPFCRTIMKKTHC